MAKASAKRAQAPRKERISDDELCMSFISSIS
jgi:hypothetical protein